MTTRVCALIALAIALAGGAGAASAAGSACTPNELVLAGGSGQTAQLGKTFAAPLQVQLANTTGCQLTGNLAGVNIDFDAPGSGPSGIFAGVGSRVAVVGTDPQGMATAPPFTANDSAGSYSVDAESDYGTVNLYLANTAGGLPASITATGGAGQQGAVNSQYAQPLQARVTDANGNPVQGATVSFAVIPGTTGAGASFLGQPTAATDSNGLATSPPVVANGSPGTFAAVASTDGIAAVATFTLDNHAAAVAISAVRAADPSAAVGTRYRRPLHARVVDGSGRPIEGASVTFTIVAAGSGAGASFAGGAATATVLTDADGQAGSPPLTANKTAGTFTATAGMAGSGQAASYRLTNLAGSAASLTAGAASGETTGVRTRFPVPLAVTVADRNGNPVAHATVIFAAPARGPSGHFRRAARTARVVTNSKGIAVAPPFTANAKAGGYVVTASVKGTSARAAFALVNR